MGNNSDLAPETKSAQALRQIDSMMGGISPGIYPSTTYVRDENYQLIDARHSYGRDENPGFAVAEKVLAELEGGSAALLFSSGSSAAMAVVQSVRPCHLRVTAGIAAADEALLEHGDITDAMFLGKVIGRGQAVAAGSDNHDIIGFS